MAQTTKERKKNRSFYEKETIRYYKLSKLFSGNNKEIQEKNSFFAYDKYKENGGTKTYAQIIKGRK